MPADGQPGTLGKGRRHGCCSLDVRVPREHTLLSVRQNQALRTEHQTPTLSVWPWLGQGHPQPPARPRLVPAPSRRGPGWAGGGGGALGWGHHSELCQEENYLRRVSRRQPFSSTGRSLGQASALQGLLRVGAQGTGDSWMESTTFPSLIWRQRGKLRGLVD